MQTNTKSLLTFMHVIFWIIFIGLLIKTGTLLVSLAISLLVSPEAFNNLHLDVDMLQLYHLDTWPYIYVSSFVISLMAMKAYIAYLVIRIFSKINLDHPFSANVAALISTISHVTLGTGIVALIANAYVQWLGKRGVAVSHHWEGSEFLFLAGIIFIIAQVFQKGLDIQSENELTI